MKAIIGAIAIATLGGAAAAQESRDRDWYINVGAIGVFFDESADINIGGALVPGASANIPRNYSLSFEIGRRFDNNWAVSFTGGIPPTADLNANGTLAGTNVGRVDYAPAVLTAHYHFQNFGPKFEPYIGAGVNYTLIYNQRDIAVDNLDVDDGFGFVLQAGFESAINDRWGVFFDVKKIFLEVDATATVGGAPLDADIIADPLLVSTGVTFRW